MALTPPPPTPESAQAGPVPTAGQGRRRAVYGVNVAVSLVVALVLVLLTNWFAVWGFGRLPDGVRPWVRYDLTATRSYTLSPQTRRVLDGLAGPVELIGVYRDGSAEAQAVTDLLGEYDRGSSDVAVRMMHPDRDLVELRGLYGDIEAQLAGVNGGGDVRGAIDRAMVGIETLADRLQQRVDDFERVAATLDRDIPGERAGALVLDGLAGNLVAWIDEYRRALTSFEASLDEPLPPLENIRGWQYELLAQAIGGRLPELDGWLAGYGRNRDLPPAAQDAAIRNRRAMQGWSDELRAVIAELASAVVTPDYERLRGVLRAEAFVIVRQGGRVRVVALGDMFLSEQNGPAVDETTAADTVPVRFLGEERLTGAVVSVGLERPPLLVLVSGDGRPMLGREGQYNYIAERARASGFEVSTWGVVDESGRAINPPPKVEAARRVVWAVLPADPSLPTAAPSRARIAEAMIERLGIGDGVLFVPGLRVNAAVAEADPMVELAAGLGIGVDPGSLVLRPVAGATGEVVAESTFRVERWSDHLITRPLVGREFWLELAQPVTASGDAEALVEVGVDGMWVDDEPLAGGDRSTARAEDEERVESQVVAAVSQLPAAESGRRAGRLAVIADDLWATDALIMGRRAGGNAELFANVAYWLGGLEDAIGLTPRTQGRQRIGPMSEESRRAVRGVVLAAVPLGSLVLGVVVWAMRRRG